MPRVVKVTDAFVDRWIRLAAENPEDGGDGGRSRFHLYLGGALLSSIFGSQNLYTYTFGIYTMQPEFVQCQNLISGKLEIVEQSIGCLQMEKYQDCKAYFDDEKGYYNFRNWITTMDLVCSNQDNNAYWISLFGVVLMLGLAFGSFTLTSLSDIFGRKAVLLICLLASSIFLIASVSSQSSYTMTVFFTFLFGMTTACRYSVAVMHAIEISTRANSAFYITSVLIFDAAASYIMGIYYYFIKSMDAGLILLLLI